MNMLNSVSLFGFSRIGLLIGFLGCLVIVLLSNKKAIKKCQFWIAPIILILIVVLRSEAMADYSNYLDAYALETKRFEPAYHLLYWLLHSLTLPAYSFILVMGILTVGIKWEAVKKMSTLPLMSLMIWMADMIILQDMVAIRAALAGSIGLWVAGYSYKQEKIKMWLCILISICCHYSALIFLIIPLFSTTKPYRFIYVVGIGISLVLGIIEFSITDFLGIINLAFVENLYEMYQYQKGINVLNLLVVGKVLVCIALWCKINEIQKLNPVCVVLLKMYTLGIVMFFLCSKMISVALRFGELLWVSEIILFPYLAYILGKKYFKIGKLLPISVAIILFFINFNAMEYWNPELMPK